MLAEGETPAAGEFVPVLHNDELHDVLEGNADIESAVLIDTLEHVDLLISDLSTEKLVGDAYLDDDIENDCIFDQKWYRLGFGCQIALYFSLSLLDDHL